MSLTAADAGAITPEQFLKMDPRDHPDYVGDYARGAPNRAGRPKPTVFMPNLCKLIELRIGGLSRVPRVLDEDWCDWDLYPIESITAATVQDEQSGQVYAEFTRYGGKLRSINQDPTEDDARKRPEIGIRKWHPQNADLVIGFYLPWDWWEYQSKPWEIFAVQGPPFYSTTDEFDRLAAQACDIWIRDIQKSPKTQVRLTTCHVMA
jgi:hypothetical protein